MGIITEQNYCIGLKQLDLDNNEVIRGLNFEIYYDIKDKSHIVKKVDYTEHLLEGSDLQDLRSAQLALEILKMDSQNWDKPEHGDLIKIYEVNVEIKIKEL